MDSIERNLSDIMEKISKSSQQSGRNSSEITLVAVTKTVDADRINEAVACGRQGRRRKQGSGGTR